MIIMVGLILYNVIPTPEGDTAEQSVFSTSYWYNYGHSLFFEWRCSCSQHVTLVSLNDNVSDDVDDDGNDA